MPETTAQNPPDAAFVSAARQGDKKAFAALVDRYFGTVWAIAYSRLTQRSLADDLAQEVFLVAFLHIGNLSDPNRFAGWLSQITHNRASDWQRQRRRASDLIAMVPQEELASLPAPRKEPHMDREEEFQSIRQAVFALPPEQREIVMLKFAEGLNQAEIARRLEVHPATIGRQLEKAMGAMRESLQSDIERSARTWRPSQPAALRTAGIVTVVAGMSGSSKAALISAAGSAPKLSAIAIGTGAKSIGTGTIAMTLSKPTIIAMTATVFLGALGVTLYTSGTAVPPSAPATQTAVAQAAAPSLPPELAPGQLIADEELIRAIQLQCYPQPILDCLLNELPKLVKEIDPTGKLPVFSLAHSMDSQGGVWLGIAEPIPAAGGNGDIEMGYTSTTGPIGVVTDKGLFIPVIRTIEPGSGKVRMKAHIDGPWAGGGSAIVIMRWGVNDNLRPGVDNTYSLRLQNYPGPDCIQQLVLVLPATWKLRSSSETVAATQRAGDFTVLVWQKHIEPKKGLVVDVKLDKVEGNSTPPR